MDVIGVGRSILFSSLTSVLPPPLLSFSDYTLHTDLYSLPLLSTFCLTSFGFDFDSWFVISRAPMLLSSFHHTSLDKALGLCDPTFSVPGELRNTARKGHIFCRTFNSGTTMKL